MSDYLTVVEFAEKYRLHPETVRDWLRLRKIPCIKTGGRWKIRIGNEDAFFASCKNGGDDE